MDTPNREFWKDAEQQAADAAEQYVEELLASGARLDTEDEGEIWRSVYDNYIADMRQYAPRR